MKLDQLGKEISKERIEQKRKKRLNRIGYKQILRYETGLDRIECKEQNIKMDLIGQDLNKEPNRKLDGQSSMVKIIRQDRI